MTAERAEKAVKYSSSQGDAFVLVRESSSLTGLLPRPLRTDSVTACLPVPHCGHTFSVPPIFNPVAIGQYLS